MRCRCRVLNRRRLRRTQRLRPIQNVVDPRNVEWVCHVCGFALKLGDILQSAAVLRLWYPKLE